MGGEAGEGAKGVLLMLQSSYWWSRGLQPPALANCAASSLPPESRGSKPIKKIEKISQVHVYLYAFEGRNDGEGRTRWSSLSHRYLWLFCGYAAANPRSRWRKSDSP